MPELPEIETIRRVLGGLLPGRVIRKVTPGHPKMLRGESPEKFRTGLIGREFLHVERRAKFLILRLDRESLVAHLGMSGQVFFADNRTPLPAGSSLPDRHTHLQLDLEPESRLLFRDPRRFGRYILLSREMEKTFFRRLGPEPLSPEFDVGWLAGRLRGRQGPVKALLLDQRIAAGMGNIYTDEALHRARIDPRTPGGQISGPQTKKLHAAIRSVLEEAVYRGGTSLSDYLDPRHRQGTFQLKLRVYGREGRPCVECATPIRKGLVAQRGTHWCPRCQKRRRVRPSGSQGE
jgi:formamidopyrimidine-DNA glycosylase